MLSDAYRAETASLATYQNVLARLGQVGPFPNVSTAEERHLATVEALLSRYGVATPAAAPGQAAPATLHAACDLGEETEEDLIDFYEQAMPTVQSYPDVANAFTNLLKASRDSHLPAFEKCA